MKVQNGAEPTGTPVFPRSPDPSRSPGYNSRNNGTASGYLMKSFRVDHVGIQEFCQRVQDEIRARDFQEIASLRCHGELLRVEFSWMGRSVLEYRLCEDGEGFNALFKRERISPLHLGFRKGFEERFEQILKAVGAEILP